MNSKIYIMKKLKFTLITLAFILVSCDKYSDYPFIKDSESTPFKLVDVSKGSLEVSLSPTLQWEKAFDCGFCEITYEIYLGTEKHPRVPVASEVIKNQYRIQTALSPNLEYNWWVLARDSQGNIKISELGSFTTRSLHYNSVTSDAAFSKRANHTSIAFDNKLWVVSGYEGHYYETDVWYSSNGASWSAATTSTPFYGRSGHATVVFDNKMWVIGGYIGGENSNDIWYSDDGINWIRATDPPFSKRVNHTAAVYDNKIWVIGGHGNSAVGGELNDVWYTTDGISWVEATAGASFEPRAGHTTVVHDDKLWVIGGRKSGTGSNGLMNDVWFSSDGVYWSTASPSAAFSKRQEHTTVVYDNKIWVIGGKSATATENDIWSSPDGNIWSRATSSAPFSTRQSHTSVVFNSKIWIIGGQQSNAILDRVNDVWTIE